MRRLRSLAPLVAASLLATIVAAPFNPASVARAAETKDIVVLGTSDIHGTIDNYDYFTDSVPSASSGRGLTKVETYVKSVLAQNPNTILIDDGDTIQGSPLNYYFEVEHPELAENPMAATMNAMGFVASTVGNHEFNYGPTVFKTYQDEAQFPLLSANVTGCQDYTFQPYVIKDVDGVQVGILGLTPPAVKYWERPENIVGCVFGDAVAAADQYVPEMQAAGADVIVVAAHTGLDETYGYGLEENFAKALAEDVPGIDVILAGHAHANVASQLVNGVLITEPYYQARNVSDIRITVTGSGSDWSVTSKSSSTPAVASYAEDPDILAITQPYHDATVAYVNTPIGTATADFPGGFPARVADGPTADLINEVQTEAAAAAGFPVQASLAALFNDGAKLTAGPIKLKDAYALYIYDNTLYVIDATGQQIKDELEWTANYFNQYAYQPAGVTVNSAVRDYNYDLWSGIDYKLDVTKPVGQRVVELTLDGKPLAMDQHVRVALNNYRAGGQFATAPRLYQSTTEVRQLITDWIIAKGTISPSDVYVHNFDLLPPVSTWQSATADQPISRADNAELLWTAFGQTAGAYVVPIGNDKKAATIDRQSEFYLLSDVGLKGLHDVTTDWKLLKQYPDWPSTSGWARDATAFVIQTGIFMPTADKILPLQQVTNAEALAWVREARFPLYTFLSTNDFHGQLETGKLVSGNPVGGAAYDMTYIEQYRALNPLGTSLYDAGDLMQGTPISNLLQGASTIDVFNHMGYQVATVGNHEFDWGLTTLQDRMAQADFPFVVANIFNEGTDTRPSWAKPTAMFTVKGQQVGVIGVTSQYTPGIVMAGNTAGLEFRAPAPIVSQLASQLRAAGADLVVVLAHMPDVYGGVVSQEMATLGVPGVDLIISGHSHSGYTGKVGDVPIIQAYSSGTAIGVSDLRYDRLERDVASSSLKVVTTYNKDKAGNDIGEDPGIAALVAAYKAEIAPIVDAVKATTLGPITKTANASGESPMGDLIADAQAWKGGTQLAFMNPGGVRADIAYSSYPHDVTYGDFLTVQPFDNKLVTMKLTGSQIYDLLEQQFVVNRILLVSGLRYTYDKTLPAGSRVTSLTLSDGTPIAQDATLYSLTCNEYIATGGDGFSVFLSGTDVTRIGVSDLDALIEYVQSKYGVPPSNTAIDPLVYPAIEGRIIAQ